MSSRSSADCDDLISRDDILSDDEQDEKILVYNFKSSQISRMSKQELSRKAGNLDSLRSIRVPLKPGRLPIRLKSGKGGPDIYIATVNLKWQWRWERWTGNCKELYVAGSM